MCPLLSNHTGRSPESSEKRLQSCNSSHRPCCACYFWTCLKDIRIWQAYWRIGPAALLAFRQAAFTKHKALRKEMWKQAGFSQMPAVSCLLYWLSTCGFLTPHHRRQLTINMPIGELRYLGTFWCSPLPRERLTSLRLFYVFTYLKKGIVLAFDSTRDLSSLSALKSRRVF